MKVRSQISHGKDIDTFVPSVDLNVSKMTTGITVMLTSPKNAGLSTQFTRLRYDRQTP